MVDKWTAAQGQTSNSNINGTASILITGTDSTEVIMSGRGVVKIHIPALDSCHLSFLVKVSPDDSLTVLTDMSGDTVVWPSSGATTGAVTATIPQLSGYYSFQIICSAAQNSAARTFYVSASGWSAVAPVTDIEATLEATTLTANQGTQGLTASPWFVEPVGTSSSGPLMPNAAVLADDAALPTTTKVGAVLLGYDGTNVDLVRLTTAGSILRSAPLGTFTGDGGASSGGFFNSSATAVLGEVLPHLFNGASYDRQRSNIASTVAASAARTSTLTTSDQTNYNGAMLHAVISVTVMASGGLTPVINGKGNLGTYYALLTGAKITGTGTTILRVGPGFATAVNAAAADMLPRTWNMVVTPDDATSITYSIEGNVNE